MTITGERNTARLRAHSYRPALDEHARSLIARIQQNHRDDDAVHALAAHYRAHGDYPSLANLLEGWAATRVRERAAADAYVEAADAVLVGQADQLRARRLYERALSRCPSHARALERLEQLLRELDDHAALDSTLSQLASALIGQQADDPIRAQVHFRHGQLYEHAFKSPGKAIAQYRQALTLDRTLVPAIVAARTIYLHAGKTAAVAHMYELEIAALDDPQARRDRLVTLSRLRADQLNDLDGAITVLRRALKATTGDVATLEELAARLAQRSERSIGDAASQDRFRAAELYYQIARSVPRGHAKRHLRACLAVDPDHARARHMLDELTGYSTLSPEDFQPAEAEACQAELDARITGRYPPGGPAGAGRAAEREDAAGLRWLNDDICDAPSDGPERMAPVSDRPPAPFRTRDETAPLVRSRKRSA